MNFDFVEIMKWQLDQLDTLYLCAIGEEGFSEGGYRGIWYDDKLNLKNKVVYMEMARKSWWGAATEIYELWEISKILDIII